MQSNQKDSSGKAVSETHWSICIWTCRSMVHVGLRLNDRQARISTIP